MDKVQLQEPRPNGVTLKGDGPYTVCPVCGKQIHFIKTVHGHQMPCEIELKTGDGRMTLVTHEGRTVRKAAAEVAGYEPHWGFCDHGSRRADGAKDLVIKQEGGAV